MKKEHKDILTIRTILKSDLNSRNKATAIGAYALPILPYGFGVINWTLEEIRKLDKETRRILTIHVARHPKSNVDCLVYISRKPTA